MTPAERPTYQPLPMDEGTGKTQHYNYDADGKVLHMTPMKGRTHFAARYRCGVYGRPLDLKKANAKLDMAAASRPPEFEPDLFEEEED